MEKLRCSNTFDRWCTWNECFNTSFKIFLTSLKSRYCFLFQETLPTLSNVLHWQAISLDCSLDLLKLNIFSLYLHISQLLQWVLSNFILWPSLWPNHFLSVSHQPLFIVLFCHSAFQIHICAACIFPISTSCSKCPPASSVPPPAFWHRRVHNIAELYSASER